ncbi:MAG: hypothetical protein K2J48_11335 [Muribaculaceae bacterium]|nr:hypothetical protein [Muribaculaceae bacterium]
MAPLMKTVDANDDVIALQLTVGYEAKDTEILKYGGIALFFAKGWKEFISDEDKFNQFKVNIWTQALGFFRGIICEKVRGTLIEPFFIPQMPDKDIIPIPLK